jgi:hypothetical protein
MVLYPPGKRNVYCVCFVMVSLLLFSIAILGLLLTECDSSPSCLEVASTVSIILVSNQTMQLYKIPKGIIVMQDFLIVDKLQRYFLEE